MLTTVEVRTNQGALLSLPLEDVTDGFVIQDISGLDPVQASVVSSSFATMDGEQYESSRRGKRNIVLTLGLEPDWATFTVRQLRNRLYDFFMPKSDVSLRFFTEGEATVDISGKVESFTSALFTKEPTVSISILCFDPDFYDITPGKFSSSSVATVTDTNVSYDGTIETGFLFRLLVNRSLTDFTLYNRPQDGVLRSMPFAGALVAGDVLEISTVPGAKHVSRIQSGNTKSMLYGLSPYADWIQLFPGDNQIRLSIAGATVPYTIEYTNKYGGL